MSWHNTPPEVRAMLREGHYGPTPQEDLVALEPLLECLRPVLARLCSASSRLKVGTSSDAACL